MRCCCSRPASHSRRRRSQSAAEVATSRNSRPTELAGPTTNTYPDAPSRAGVRTLPKYLVLIYGNPRIWADLPAEWHAANAARHQALIASAVSAIRGVSELEPATHAVSVRGDPSGRTVVTMGPFHDTPEALGGYYILDA